MLGRYDLRMVYARTLWMITATAVAEPHTTHRAGLCAVSGIANTTVAESTMSIAETPKAESWTYLSDLPESVACR